MFSTMICESSGAHGHANRRLETNCDEKPFTVVAPPRIGPHTQNGKSLPSCSNPNVTPRFPSASSTGRNGLVRSDASPSNRRRLLPSAAIEANRFVLVPEFSMLKSSEPRVKSPPTPVTAMLLPAILTSAPMLRAAAIAEAPSPVESAFAMWDVPCARVETTSARMVCDFEAGTAIVPASTDFLTRHFTQRLRSVNFPLLQVRQARPCR